MMVEERSEIVFFDVETTVPTKPGQGFAILEFGAILVCPKKLVELRSYSTLVKPADLSHISSLSVRCNGITKEAVVLAPAFADIADVVYDLLHGRIWAGHNILKFDCARIREAFAEINRPSPEPKGAIDSLVLLRQKFGRRAGDMKMASLATYFGLGQQTHRSLDDVRMNLEVLKYCATVLFLESSLPDVFTENSWVFPTAVTRSRRNGKISPESTGQNESRPSSSVNAVICSAESSTTPCPDKNNTIFSLVMPPTEDVASPLVESTSAQIDPFDMSTLCDEMEKEQPDEDSMEEEKNSLVSEESSSSVGDRNPHSSDNSLEPDDVSIPSISATLVPIYTGYRKIQILHQGSELQLRCKYLKVRFGVSTKFVDHAGRPKLNFVVNPPPNLLLVLEKADSLAKELFDDSGSSSDWHPVVNKKPGYYNYPTIRLHIPTVASGETSRLETEILEKDDTGTRRVELSGADVVELDSLLSPGNLVDASFSLDSYDYQQNAGLRLVVKKLIVHSSR